MLNTSRRRQFVLCRDSGIKTSNIKHSTAVAFITNLMPSSINGSVGVILAVPLH
jgi:hypothetical protein